MDSPVRIDPSFEGAARDVAELYQSLLTAWNERSADRMARLFTLDGSAIGFDGSQMNGATEIETTIQQIFADHETGLYVGKIRRIRLVSPEVGLLEGVAGIIPAGKIDLNPTLNAVQTMVAVHDALGWRIALYQNTPAAFHGRPELGQALTDELRAELRTAAHSR